jgi:L-lysine exporter family protein LysE/ArgO
MLEALFLGLITGLVLCWTFGTVFFALLQNSVDNGYKSGFKIAFGVVVCDLLMVVFALFGTSYLPQVPGFDLILTAIGVVFLAVIGVANLMRGAPRLAYPQTRFGNFVYYFSTGFLLNGLNPVNFITWVTLTAYLRNSLHYDINEQMIFLGGSLVGIFATQSGLALSAHRLKNLFTPRVVVIFNRITGIVFLGVAIQLTITRLYPFLTQWLAKQ